MSKGAYLKHKSDQHKGVQSPHPKSPVPTEQEYTSGQYTRYFVQDVTDKEYIIEIDGTQFDTIPKKTGINGKRYKSVSFKWRLTGRMYDEWNAGIRTYAGVHDSNKRMVEKQEKKIRGITEKVVDYLQHTRIDSDYVTNNKTTINEAHFHYLSVDENGDGWTSEAVNPKNPHIRHMHKVENWIIIESQSNCYPNCVMLYGHPGAPPHTHEIE